jgi:predicted aldo/keto reductase-like oxidoreductase
VVKQGVNKGRRKFIKEGAIGLAGAAFLPSVIRVGKKAQTKDTEKERKFIYRTLGKTGIKLPIISMGIHLISNPNLVRAALDAGIVYLDTPPNYSQLDGLRAMIKSVIKERPRASYVIATRVSELRRNPRTDLFLKETKAGPFVEEFEKNLKQLGLDHVDIFLLAGISSKEAALFGTLLNAMEKLRKEGKTRFIGLTTHRNEPEVIRAAVESEVYDVVMSAYNFRQPHREEVKKAIALAAKSGLGVVAMKTMAGVYWDRERKHPINAKATLKWVLGDKNVHTTVPSITTFDQLEKDLSVMEDLTLTPEEKADLKLGEKLALTGLYCQQCEKCLAQCPNNFDIPTLMRSYMYAYGYRNPTLAKETLEKLDLDGVPCKNCDTCQVICSMGFDVRNKIMDIARIKAVPEEFLV